jgi:2-succinyl-5-enolpyruvyl-6-hydroxy-3-cyclohexene-1-carboxylate synthase
MAQDLAQAPNHNIAFARALLSELARAGARQVCLSPGSRSAPLAIALTDEPALSCTVHIDERVAGFYALGLAKASRRPVILICTSGSAAAHYLPAVIEAHYAGVPLVILTADRPHEVREWGAGQTIDQVRLFGSHTRWFAEAPLPNAQLIRYARALGSRAVAHALGSPAGPVHLNLPFREPLDPREAPEDQREVASEALARAGRGTRSFMEARHSPRIPSDALVRDLAGRMRGAERGVISCGPVDAGASFASAVSALTEATGWPLIADGASGLRTGPASQGASLVSSADLLLRTPAIAARLSPDFVLRLGRAPTSKSFRLWLEAQPPVELVRVDPDANWHDPSHLASEVIDADPEVLCRALASALGAPGKAPPWLREFQALDARAAAALARGIDSEERLMEPRAIRELCACLPEGAILYVASSMPIRDLDAFLQPSARTLRVLCNRGANGIDGLVASALGAAAARQGPVVLLLGDVALAHDIGALIASRRLESAVTIVLFDNAGGGIFSVLPVARHGESVRFREYFLTPPDLQLPELCHAAGARYIDIESWEHFRSSLKQAVGGSAVSLLRLAINQQANLDHFRSLVAQAAEGAES